MKDVVLFYGGLPYENEIVEAYRKYLPQTSSDDFVGMKAANWGANAVEGHLNDVHLAGWPRGSARARLSDWVGCGGGAAGSGYANGSGSAAAKVRAEAEEVKSPEDVAVEQTLLVLEDPKTASMTTKEVKIEAAKRVRAETGKRENHPGHPSACNSSKHISMVYNVVKYEYYQYGGKNSTPEDQVGARR
jgi:hypothetical protein